MTMRWYALLPLAAYALLSGSVFGQTSSGGLATSAVILRLRTGEYVRASIVKELPDATVVRNGSFGEISLPHAAIESVFDEQPLATRLKGRPVVLRSISCDLIAGVVVDESERTLRLRHDALGTIDLSRTEISTVATKRLPGDRAPAEPGMAPAFTPRPPSSGSPASGSPVAPAPDVPSLQGKFSNLKTYITDFGRGFSSYLADVVIQEVLSRLPNPSPCAKTEAASAKSRRPSLRKQAIAQVDRMKGAWQELKKAASGVPGSAVPWSDEEADEMDQAIKAARKLLDDVNDQPLVRNMRLVTGRVDDVREFLRLLPTRMEFEDHDLDSFIPSSISIPCIGGRVTR
jgi:hypothetical protein